MPNEVGKMATQVYTETILPQIIEDHQEHDLKLCQDADSARMSTSTIPWTKSMTSLLLRSLACLPILETHGTPCRECLSFKTMYYGEGWAYTVYSDL